MNDEFAALHALDLRQGAVVAMLNDWQRYRIDELRRRAQRSGMAAEVGAMVFDAMVRLLEGDADISADSLIAELEHACREWDCG